MSLIERYKGIHPGLVLDRILSKKSIAQRPFALSINEHPQTINAITKGRRRLNTSLALKIELKLGLDEGTLVLLQTYYDIDLEKKKVSSEKPDLTKIRKVVFWDADFEKINWKKQWKSVIQRIFERGNSKEKEEIIRFYGNEMVQKVIGNRFESI